MTHIAPRRKGLPIARAATTLAAIAGLALAAACSNDAVTSPTVVPEYKTVKVSVGGSLKSLYPMAPLSRDVALSSPIVRSFTFDKKGGKIEIKETGLRIDVPSGAIPGSSLTITVTALAGSGIAYDFQPHGTVFLKPLDFEQDLDGTSWEKLKLKGTLLGGYFADPSQLNVLGNGLALLDELFPVTLNKNTASFDIRHFSGYMVSGGRQTAYADSDF